MTSKKKDGSLKVNAVPKPHFIHLTFPHGYLDQSDRSIYQPVQVGQGKQGSFCRYPHTTAEILNLRPLTIIVPQKHFLSFATALEKTSPTLLPMSSPFKDCGPQTEISYGPR